MEIVSLLEALGDPFSVFPVESVSGELGTLIDDREGNRSDRADWWGVSTKYRSVEDEHDLEAVRLLIGSTFVLGQAAITQAVSIVQRLAVLSGKASWLPKGKLSTMSTAAPLHAGSGMSEIVLYDAVANYFKHRYEWPPNWEGASEAQQRTIGTVLKLGLLPDCEDNLLVALESLGMTTRSLGCIGTVIRQWRESLALDLRAAFENHGFL